jgi:hypothetical protein
MATVPPHPLMKDLDFVQQDRHPSGHRAWLSHCLGTGRSLRAVRSHSCGKEHLKHGSEPGCKAGKGKQLLPSSSRFNI